MLLKVIIAEDNDLFRKKLIKKISAFKELEVVYSTNNGIELLNAAKKIKPEIIISDIDMPGMTGIEALKFIRQEIPDTEIIFITAYDDFLKEAIQLYAFDYIEKPVNILRLKETLEKIKRRLLIKDKLIEFKIENSFKYVRANDLYFVEALKKKTKIYTSNEEFISDFPLKEVEQLLKENIFFKASRSYIINLNKVKGIKPYSRTSFEIVFRDKDYEAYLSKKYYEDFRIKIKNLHN